MSFPGWRYCLEIGSSIGWNPRFWLFWLDRAMMMFVHSYLREGIVFQKLFRSWAIVRTNGDFAAASL
jgi:hypothetical protein